MGAAYASETSIRKEVHIVIGMALAWIRRGSRALCVGAAVGATALAGCGSSETTPAAKPVSNEPGSPATMVAPDRSRMSLRCEAGFAPTPHLLGRNWRRHSVRVGPVSLLRARDLGNPKVDGGRRPIAFKQPFLVESSSRGVLRIWFKPRVQGGFAALDTIANGREPDLEQTSTRAEVEGCDSFVGRIAFGHALIIDSPACATVTFEPSHGRPTRRVFGIGRRACSHS
jgi:hypothetical protein